MRTSALVPLLALASCAAADESNWRQAVEDRASAAHVLVLAAGSTCLTARVYPCDTPERWNSVAEALGEADAAYAAFVRALSEAKDRESASSAERLFMAALEAYVLAVRAVGVR